MKKFSFSAVLISFALFALVLTGIEAQKPAPAKPPTGPFGLSRVTTTDGAAADIVSFAVRNFTTFAVWADVDGRVAARAGFAMRLRSHVGNRTVDDPVCWLSIWGRAWSWTGGRDGRGSFCR